MELYTFLRAMADSWAVLGLTLFFIGMVFWVFRPGAKQLQQDAANVIFRHEKKPVSAPSKEA